DSSTPQIEITAKLVDVDAEALRGMGIDWRIGGVSKHFIDPVTRKPVDLNPLNPNNDGNQALSPDHSTTIADPATTLPYGIFKPWGDLEAQLQLLEQNRK